MRVLVVRDAADDDVMRDAAHSFSSGEK